MIDILIKSLEAGVAALGEYLSAHVLLCLIPAFFIAGAIGALLKRQQILKYMGPKANPAGAYGFAALSGTLLAVCSCTILPLFASIREKGAGLGPAITFLFSGPAISVLAILYTGSALGWDIGAARALSAIGLSVVLGLTMALIFKEKLPKRGKFLKDTAASTSNLKLAGFFIILLAILLVATAGIDLYAKAAALIMLILLTQYAALSWFTKEDVRMWFRRTWFLAKKIFPLILVGVFITGVISFFLPYEYVAKFLGGNSIAACFLAALIGTILYMPTILEVPIVGTLLGYKAGVIGAGPALALLLAGPSVSLPSLLVTKSVLGNKKTAAYAVLVVFYSALAGFLFGLAG